MLTEARRSEYPLPEGFGNFRMVALAMGDAYYELHQVSPADMKSLRNMSNDPVRGVPVYYATSDRMELFPEPSGEWEVARCWDGARQW